MSRAVLEASVGVAEIAVAGGLLASGAGAAFGYSLLVLGASTEIAAIASAISRPQGIDVTVRESAAPRQVVYGTMRVGGVEVYESTTGSSKDQYNMVIVFASHEITNFLNLYLDGRQVFWAGMSVEGCTDRNGIIFGGGGDGNSHTGPNGQQYTFNNAVSGHSGVYCSCRFGDQPAGDYMHELQANDATWGPDANNNTPSLMGCAYLYLKVEYDTNVFPSKPDIKVDIAGKAVYDPRTGETAFTDNWALVVADLLTDTVFGFGDVVNQENLIAAANICDEYVEYYANGGGQENRYTANYAFKTDRSPGDVLSDLMTGAGGRISYIGGEWYIFPAAYVGPVQNFDYTDLIDNPTWSPQRKGREKFNRVRGTYIAPNFPWNVVGDEYTSPNGYNDQGQTFNVFPYEFQPNPYPQYACDTLHGYANDQFLAEDQGVQLTETLDFSSVCSITQAQRLAKIHLLRNRQQGSGTLTFGPEARGLLPNDVFTFTWPERGWVNKLLEVNRIDTVIQQTEQGPVFKVVVSVNETDPSVYVWNETDELAPSATAIAPTSSSYYNTAPPTNMELVSSAATALVQPDGTVIPQIQVTWETPADIRATQIWIQFQLTTATSWTDAGTVSVASNIAFIPAIAGEEYNVRICSLRSNGATSAWVTILGFTAGLVLSIEKEAQGIGVGSLVSEAYSDGTASIICTPFIATYGLTQVSIFSTGPVTISGLLQNTLFYVYYIDPTLSNSNPTPIATMNESDFAGKMGYWLIDSIITLSAASGTATATNYYPTTAQDVGTRSTVNPSAAYLNNGAQQALVSANLNGTTGTNTFGDLLVSGWPAIQSSNALTLVVMLNATFQPQGEIEVTVNYSGTTGTVFTTTSNQGVTVAIYSIPAGIYLNTVSVSISAITGISLTAGESCYASTEVYACYITTNYNAGAGRPVGGPRTGTIAQWNQGTGTTTGTTIPIGTGNSGGSGGDGGGGGTTGGNTQ